MSTRRARIKAVTSLPPRRKNAAVVENKVKEISEKSSKSPRTPSQSPRLKITLAGPKTNENHTKNSVIDTQITSEDTLPINLAVSKSSPRKAIATVVPVTPEKVSSTNCKKNTPNVFASPARRTSPKKTFASPLAPSPKFTKNLDLQRPRTPQTRPTTTQKISESNEQIAEKIVSKSSHNDTTKKDNAKDDYNIPSVPESVDDEAMDGIVPLRPAANIPKPIDILKNEIISENAEVLFDPIIPLPSPSKIRPKLRPVPRLAPLRRNSVQGSASESEDENRRNLLNSKDRQTHDVQTLQSLPNRDVSRVRNDSVCSSVSQVGGTIPAAPASPAKEKQNQKTRRQEESRRRMAMRRHREHTTKRDTLTMYDLIFYNPTSNPLVLNEDEIKLKEANEKDEAERLTKEKEAAAKPESPKKAAEAAPVPQIKLGPKGEIILDEQSLVIKQTESDRQVSSVVHEGAWGSGGGQYRKLNFNRAAGWSAEETVRFYRALAAIGTDFTLMAPLFPDRTRKQIKDKFKKEERVNGAQIDKALRATLQFDVLQLKEEFEEERRAAAREAEAVRERLLKDKQAEKDRLKSLREGRIRHSRGSKALESATVVRQHKAAVNAESIIEHSIKARKQYAPNTRATTQIPKVPITATASASKQKSTENTPSQSKGNTPSLQIKTPEAINALQIPSNIEMGSLVVLTVNDPSSPAKKMLQTYIASGPGKLTPVALPPTFLNCVVGYMKKGTPKGSNVSSPQLLSPNSVASLDSRSSTPSISVIPSPAKRQRHSSYTITQL